MTISIIPKPQSMTVGEGVFSITAETIIVAADEAVPVAELLASLLRTATGYDLPIQAEGEGGIQLILDEGSPSEEYALNVTPEQKPRQMTRICKEHAGKFTTNELFF